MKNQIVGKLVFQFALGVIYLVGISLWDSAVAASALLGCTAGLVPEAYIGFRMLRDMENSTAPQWLGYAIRSEVGKWVIMGSIFLAAFTSDYAWDPLILFAGFILIQLSGRFAPFVIKGN